MISSNVLNLNVPYLEPNTLKFRKKAYFVVLGNVITCVSLQT